MSDVTDPAVLRQLIDTRTALAATVTKMRRRNAVSAVLSVLSLVAVVIYLGYAAYRYGGEVTPELVAANVQASLQAQMPQARATLEQNLRGDAPQLVNNAFDQVQAMPATYADNLHRQATAKMDAAMPAVQDQMYQSLKQALDQSRGPLAVAGSKDEDELKSTLSAVADVYATQTMRFVEQEHGTYAADAAQFTDYLDRLATSPNLDHRDQLHRDMFRTVFALVRERAAAAPTNP